MKFKGEISLVLIVIVIAAAAAVAGIGTGYLRIPGLNAVVQPTTCVLQTDYNYIGCVEDPLNQPTLYIGGTNAWFMCPTVTSKCTVAGGMSSSPHVYSCPTGTNCVWGINFGRRIDTGGVINPGEWVYAGDQYLNSVLLKQYYTVLVNCGINTGTCANGAVFPVSGASFCQFNTNERIYDQNGAIVQQQQGAFAYTVPYGRAYAYPSTYPHCLDVPTCNVDTDCSQYGAFQGVYNGQSVGYSVTNNMLSVYGCQPNNLVTLGKDVLGSVNLSTQQVTLGKCAAKTSFATQCTPGSSSCGANAFCQDTGNLQFKCSSTTQCTTNYDCGSQISCDGSTKQLRTPACTGGQCTFTTQAVECCDYYNCADGWYCDVSHKCKEGGQTKVPCPNQCCQGSTTYFDKPCAGSLLCCGDGSCRESCSGGTQGDCSTPGHCGTFDFGCMIGCWWAAYGWIVILMAAAVIALCVVLVIIAVK
jgi:hypothetical protein